MEGGSLDLRRSTHSCLICGLLVLQVLAVARGSNSSSASIWVLIVACLLSGVTSSACILGASPKITGLAARLWFAVVLGLAIGIPAGDLILESVKPDHVGESFWTFLPAVLARGLLGRRDPNQEEIQAIRVSSSSLLAAGLLVFQALLLVGVLPPPHWASSNSALVTVYLGTALLWFQLFMVCWLCPNEEMRSVEPIAFRVCLVGAYPYLLDISGCSPDPISAALWTGIMFLPAFSLRRIAHNRKFA